MKKLTPLLLLFVIVIVTQAQSRPPRIRIPGSTTMPQGCFTTNTVFNKGQRYYSADNRYCLTLQDDGNLVIYKFPSAGKYKAVWSTGTNGVAIKSCVFQDDGNLVLYDYAGKARWAANSGSVEKSGLLKGDTFYPSGPNSHWLTLQNDGNLVIYVGKYPTAVVRWSAGSFEKN